MQRYVHLDPPPQEVVMGASPQGLHGSIPPELNGCISVKPGGEPEMILRKVI